MIRATWGRRQILAAEDTPSSRRIQGVAVPWGVPGRVSDGTTVVFAAGSLDPASRPVALRDHDRSRPIGVVTAAKDNGDAMEATIAVSKTRDGDESLVLAADGALGALSVGAEPTEFSYDADGTLYVTAADWQELSLLTLGAFSDAKVSTVTASGGSMPTTATDAPEEEQEQTAEEETSEETEESEDTTAIAPTLVPIQASRGTRTVQATHPYAHVGIRDLARLIAAGATDSRYLRQVQTIMASPGARLNAPFIEAALTNVTLVGTDNVGAAYRPGYQAELMEIVAHGTPAIDAVSQGDLERGDYPNKTFNSWTKAPTVAVQATEKTQVNSTAVAITATSVPVQTWATGNDLSQQLLDLGSPGFVDDYIRAAAMSYAKVTDTYAVTTLLAGATAVTTTTGDSLPTIIGKLFGALDPTKVPPGPLFMLVSWDLGVGAIALKGTAEVPVFWDGSISFSNFIPSPQAGGLSVTVDPNMPAKTALLGPREAAMWYDVPGTPFTLRATNASLLGLDLSVFGYGAMGIKRAGALVKTTVP